MSLPGTGGRETTNGARFFMMLQSSPHVHIREQVAASHSPDSHILFTWIRSAHFTPFNRRGRVSLEKGDNRREKNVASDIIDTDMLPLIAREGLVVADSRLTWNGKEKLALKKWSSVVSCTCTQPSEATTAIDGALLVRRPYSSLAKVAFITHALTNHTCSPTNRVEGAC